MGWAELRRKGHGVVPQHVGPTFEEILRRKRLMELERAAAAEAEFYEEEEEEYWEKDEQPPVPVVRKKPKREVVPEKILSVLSPGLQQRLSMEGGQGPARTKRKNANSPTVVKKIKVELKQPIQQRRSLMKAKSIASREATAPVVVTLKKKRKNVDEETPFVPLTVHPKVISLKKDAVVVSPVVVVTKDGEKIDIHEKEREERDVERSVGVALKDAIAHVRKREEEEEMEMEVETLEPEKGLKQPLDVSAAPIAFVMKGNESLLVEPMTPEEEEKEYTPSPEEMKKEEDTSLATMLGKALPDVEEDVKALSADQLEALEVVIRQFVHGGLRQPSPLRSPSVPTQSTSKSPAKEEEETRERRRFRLVLTKFVKKRLMHYFYAGRLSKDEFKKLAKRVIKVVLDSLPLAEHLDDTAEDLVREMLFRRFPPPKT